MRGVLYYFLDKKSKVFRVFLIASRSAWPIYGEIGVAHELTVIID